MQASIETLSLIRAADEATTAAAKAGVGAVLSLVRENLTEKFPHGSAAELASILRDGKIPQHTAKRYADLTAMTVKAVTLQASLAASKVKPAEKAIAKQASVDDNLAMLAALPSMVKIRQWANEHGPKNKVKAPAVDAPAVDAPAVDAPAVDAPAVDAPAVEAMGQLREIRECLAMINAGQCLPGEALAAIAGIVGVNLTMAPASKTAKTRASTKKAA